MRLVGRRAIALPKRLLDQADRLIDGAYLRGGKLEARRPHVFINQQQPRWLEALRDQAAEKPADIAKVMQRVVEHDQIEALMGKVKAFNVATVESQVAESTFPGTRCGIV